ncbi:MAG: bifunctional riboflavin kinase/FAD synthetase [Desulfobacteraceae bacterium]|nr:MAG: bifunctional riboflavin kinase/FAD synthetase [Desulfobacteraceae bacterium]
MKLIDKIESITKPFDNAVITIGNFDGVHIGHQALFHEVIEKADAINGTSVAITFHPHPIRVLKQNGHPPLITVHEQKAELIEKTGIDVLICVPFTLDFASIPARDFVRDFLVKKIGMKAIVIGKDYTFGKNREGNLEFLKRCAKEYDFEVIVTNWIQISNNLQERISSTKIRDLVTDGKVAEAQQLLGRYYQVRGTVMTGRNRGGRLLGFPTANIKLQDELCPKTGVYAVTVECMESRFKGVANIGYSPTFEDNIFTVEVHILDFNENIYGRNIKVNFINRIRDELKFSDIDELSEQIKKDIDMARRILSL